MRGLTVLSGEITAIGAFAAAALFLAAGCSMSAPKASVGGTSYTTNEFAGVKVNGGTATRTIAAGRAILTLSDDFKVPDAPAPHWQVVDSNGQAFLLNRLVIKGEKFNKSITVPDYVSDIAKVQIWCSFAEALLGEASFQAPIAQ